MDLAHEFERFRRDGDVAALARIFDHVAPDLLRLARALSRDGEPPEDLVQSTFLTAIESRETFDACRPLEPWLAGILANHVSNARRRAARQRSPASAGVTVRSTEEEPSEIDERVIEREVWTTIASAIDELPANYREVVAPRLLRGERATTIAVRVGAPAGTVRMRLQRGIALLRRMLPRGISASLALLTLSRTSRAALAAARSHVLGHAGSSVGTAPALVASTGALLVSKKILFSFAVLALAAVGYVLTQDSAPEDPRAVIAVVAAPELADPPPTVEAANTANGVARDSLAKPQLEVPTVASVDVPDSYARALAGVRGRLLESDRSAVGNAPITLIELDSNSWVADLADSFRNVTIDPFVAESRTDGAGRFEFHGVFPRGIHALGIDLGGPRATLRFVDLPLAPGAMIDLGDIVLGARGRLQGIVVDEDGNPIAKARVRAACLPAIATRLGLERLNEHTRILSLSSEEAWVLDLPDFVRKALARLPFPTTTTDEQGRFTLDGVPVGSVSLLIDHARFVPRAFGPTALASSPTNSRDAAPQDFGSLELSRGRRVQGRVLDALHHPIASAIVTGGTDLGIGTSMFSSSNPIFANVEARTDADGRFALEAIPEEGRAVYAARSEALARWTVLASEDDDVEIVLADSLPHEFQVTRADGVAVEAIELRAGSHRTPDTGLELSSTDIDVTRCLKRESTGVFTLNGLAAGPYRGLLRTNADPAHPLGPYAFEFTISKESTVTNVVIPKARRIEVRVRESGAQSAVEHASVIALTDDSVEPSSQRMVMGTALVRSRTDVRGVATLDGLAVAPEQSIRLRVDHPRFGSQAVEVKPDQATVDVVLTTPGTLLAHLRVEGAVPPERYTLMTLASETATETSDVSFIPQLTNSDAAGDARLNSLAPGTYEYQVVTDVLSQDLGTLAARAATDILDLRPDTVARGEFSISSGQQTEITIEIAPRDEQSNASLSGTITDGGKPLSYGMVMLTPSPTDRLIEIDSSGHYEARDLPAGKYLIEVYDGVKMGDGIVLQSRATMNVEIRAGEHRTLDFAFRSQLLRVHVVSGNMPAENVMVEAFPKIVASAGGDAQPQVNVSVVYGDTNSAGDAELRISAGGTYEFTAHHPELGCARRIIDLQGDGSDPSLTLELEPGTTLTATFTIAPSLGTVDADCSILVEAAQGFSSLKREIPIVAGQREFHCEHLPDGALLVALQRLKRVRGGEYFEVVSKRIQVDAGTRNIHLDFEPDTP